MSDVFVGTAGQVVIALLVFVAVALVVNALAGGRRAGLVSALEPYTLEPLQPRPEGRHVVLAETTLARRGVGLTARLLRRSNVLPVVATYLERADWPIREAEALFFYVAGIVVLPLLAAALGGRASVIAALLVSAAVPILVVRVVIGRRRRSFESQLPDALRMLAASLRAGRSIQQALQGLASETSDPLGSELARAVAEMRLGRLVEDALGDMAVRMSSEDARFVANAVGMQRQIGGNLAEVLGTVAETMVARDRLRGEVRALTAEGRMSAVVLGILPLALGGLMYVLNPDYISVLFHEPLGRSLLAAAAGLALAGFFWMKKTMEVDV